MNDFLTAQDKLELVYFDLLSKKHYSKITVTELINSALVSRMTFYRKYEDIFDMHKKVCENLVKSVISQIDEILQKEGDDLAPYFEEFCNGLKNQKKYIMLLCGENADRKLFDLAIPIITDYMKNLKGALNENETFSVKFIIYASIATYLFSLMTGKEFTYEYIKIYEQILELPSKTDEIRKLLSGFEYISSTFRNADFFTCGMNSATDRKLIEAFCQTVKKDGKLNVSSLCKRADIARATFYLHYSSIEDFIICTQKELVTRLIKQSTYFLLCDDKEIKNASKKENFILDEYDIELMKYFTSDKQCYEFARFAFSNAIDFLGQAHISEYIAKSFLSGQNKSLETFCFGYVGVVYLGLFDYNEARFRKDIENCRMMFKLLILRNKST